MKLPQWRCSSESRFRLFCELIVEERPPLPRYALDPAVTTAYSPTRFTAADYPGLVRHNQPVDTVAVSAVLAVGNLQVGFKGDCNVVISSRRSLSGFSHC